MYQSQIDYIYNIVQNMKNSKKIIYKKCHKIKYHQKLKMSSGDSKSQRYI